MTMDFSQLHTYTPPQCAPENTGYTYSLSSSYSTAALEFEQQHQIAPVYESPRMSRRSLRLQAAAGYRGNESLADFSQNHSSGYASASRETRVLRSRKSQSTSSSRTLSLSQVATPRKTLSFLAASTPIDSSSSSKSSNFQESNVETDASLLTPGLDQSHLRQRTVTTRTSTTTAAVDGHWGQGSSHGSSSVNGDASVSKSHTMLANGYICRDCSLHSQKAADSQIARSSSSSLSLSSPSHAAETCTDALTSPSSPFTSIYTRDRNRKSKSGVLVSVSNRCLHYSKRALAPIVSVFTTLFSSAVWLGSKVKSSSERGVFAFSDSLRQAASSSWSQLWLLKENTLHRMMGHKANGYEGQADSSYCRSLNVKDLVTEDASSQLNLNGSLCDDCKGTQHSETHTVLTTQSSRPRRLAGALWSALVYAGHCLLLPGHSVVRAGGALASGAGTVAHKLLSAMWTLLAAPVKAGRGLLWLLATGWYQLVSLMSLLNVFFLTRCLPKLWKLLWLLLPLLFLLALWFWGPSTAALLAYLPAINLTEWRPASPVAFFSSMMPAPASVPAPPTEAPLKPTPASPVSQAPPVLPPAALSDFDFKRLESVERQLALLWERVQHGDQKQDERHGELLGLYSTLREQLHTQTDRESLGLWVSSLLEQKIGVLRGELEQENTLVAQRADQQKHQQESQAARLADLELMLSALSARTEDLQKKQQLFELQKEKREEEVVSSAADSPPVSVGVKQEEHDALLAEVRRLELELGKVRADLQGVAGCKGKCEQLDALQETITAQVTAQMRKELQTLFYGSGGSGDDQKEIPESLILWLSQRYVTAQDLQASLASLELSILRNISLQLEQNRAQTRDEVESQAKTLVQTVTGSVRHTSAAEGLSEEQVKLIVQNALKLYSQDRTGLVDYALESGGGSILSTRCSETYETKTALMSLFGLPLWYFSQSPRVVIQPDVYPGNCWAFKGSQGYLVIRLSLRILPTSFCVEHIPKALSPTGNITSAPQNFTVYGLDDEYQEEGKLLGHYTYQEDGESLQSFPVKEQNDKAFQIIEVRVLSNWGHPEYTCMYRFRVHGEPRPQ
ncbi:SUN domain-containing protein 1 isoform X2 [Salarias fasciatus]|uniref:SUN domain-containing protein n=3 Tax=Salarias fasciatus TaxID=181472 RepID=A0A672FUN4_SALFA|nr:SUN domain-containing protein 1 isoform X2 [Salarias fasciatus]XP_029944964.1 SUN domain-containing protein 1 isoform X2 [Salarias fasciatus]